MVTINKSVGVTHQSPTIQNNNKDFEIGSYPFFRQGKLSVSIVIRSVNQNDLDKCKSQILEFVKEKNIQVIEIN